MASVKLSNGSVFTGTPEECAVFLYKIGKGELPRGWYNSETDGPVEIANMHVAHVGNALLKIAKRWSDKLGTIRDYKCPQELIDKLEAGYAAEPYAVDLFKRLWEARDKLDWKDGSWKGR